VQSSLGRRDGRAETLSRPGKPSDGPGSRLARVERRRRWRRVQAAVAAGLVLYFGIAVGIQTQYQTVTPSPTPQKLTGNLIANPNLGPALAPWRSYPSTLFRLAHTSCGTVARLRASAPRLYGVYQFGIADPSKGETYRLSAWVRGNLSTAGRQVVVQLNERADWAGLQDIKVGAVTSRLSMRWQLLIAGGRIRRGRADEVLDAYIFVPRTIGIGDAIYINDVRLTRTAHPRNAVSGRLPTGGSPCARSLEASGTRTLRESVEASATDAVVSSASASVGERSRSNRTRR